MKVVLRIDNLGFIQRLILAHQGAVKKTWIPEYEQEALKLIDSAFDDLSSSIGIMIPVDLSLKQLEFIQYLILHYRSFAKEFLHPFYGHDQDALNRIENAIEQIEETSATDPTTNRSITIEVGKKLLSFDAEKPSDECEKTLHPCRTLWGSSKKPPKSYQSNLAEFEKELTDLINKHSLESASNTPDFVLANYLCECLKAYNKTVLTREESQNPGES